MAAGEACRAWSCCVPANVTASSQGVPCLDVRTREVGIKDIHHRVRPEHVELVRRDYVANGGYACVVAWRARGMAGAGMVLTRCCTRWETFLSYEDPQQDILIGLLRLRKCGCVWRSLYCTAAVVPRRSAHACLPVLPGRPRSAPS